MNEKQIHLLKTLYQLPHFCNVKREDSGENTEVLLDKGFLAETPSGHITVTEKGIGFLRSIKAIKKL